MDYSDVVYSYRKLKENQQKTQPKPTEPKGK